MKIKIDIDCTAEEARHFLGLPEIKPMQDALLAELQQRMSQNLERLDPDTVFRTWFPQGLEDLGQLQRSFWDQMMRAAGETESASSNRKSGGRGGSGGSGS